MTTVTLSIEGMTCGGCKARVERAIAGISPLQASVTRSPDLAVIELAPRQTAQTVIDAIAAAGYRASVAQAQAKDAL